MGQAKRAHQSTSESKILDMVNIATLCCCAGMLRELQIAGRRTPLEPLDGRIAVALEGEGEVQTCRMTIPPNEKYVLLADVLNGLTDETEVIRMAGRLIDLVNGVLFLEDAQRQPIASQGIHHRQAANGNWGVTVSMPAVSVRGRAGRISFRQPAQPTTQTLIMLKAMNDENVMDVLTYLRNVPDWIYLYKAFELMMTGSGGDP